jgi:predicted MFS family arabinose efflux permease
MVGAIYLAGVAAAMNHNLVPPVAPVLVLSLGVSLTSVGWLVSVGGIVGLILALPSGLILHRLGLRHTALLALGLVVVGAGMGAMTTDFVVLLTSRVFVGAGVVLMSVTVPASVAVSFPEESRGVPMGLASTWMSVGILVAFNGAPTLERMVGWQQVWWAAAALALAAAAVCAAFLKATPRAHAGELDDNERGLRAFVARPNIWLLAITFMCLTIAMVSILTYYPTFLVQERGYDLGVASSLTSVSMAAGLVSMPVAGFASDRLGTRKVILIASMLVMAALMLLPFRIVDAWQILALLVGLGLASGAVGAMTFAAAPEVMASPRLAAAGMSVITLGQYAGFFVGPALFGWVVETLGWDSAALFMVPIVLLGTLAAWRVNVR